MSSNGISTGAARRSPARSRSRRARATGKLAALALLVLATGATAGPAALAMGATTATVRTETAPPTASLYYEEESRQAFEGQLRAHEIREAEFNKVAEHLHLLLSDGHRVYVVYPGHQEPALQARLLAAGIPVAIEYTAKKPASTHHTIRYIVAGVLVIALIALAVLLILRRRRLADLGEGAAGAGGAAPGAEGE
jgi:hypothetical protein